jgi:protocatechuate 3,4-dioxygenase beta subunit
MVRVLIVALVLAGAMYVPLFGEQERGVVGGVVAPAPQAPGLTPRDTRPQATGTGRIAGRVVTADTGQAVRRAQVTLSGGTGLRRTTTDGNGRYQFNNLPDGVFNLSVAKPGYVNLQYGQRRPFEPGTPITLSQGRSADRIDIALPRGSVIAVRLTDDFGDPVVGAQVQVLRSQYGQDGRRRLNMTGGMFGAAMTDDRGEFRAFGLSPGEYVISATARNQVNLVGPPTADDTSEGFAPTFYPGTASAEQAQSISVGVGEETNVHFALVSARLARITGTVADSQGRPASGIPVQLMTRLGNGVSSSRGGMVSQDGSFTIAGVAPGEYSIEVRQMPRNGESVTDRDVEFASVPIVVSGADVAGVRVVLGPGATISGRVVWDGNSRLPTNPGRVMLQQADPNTISTFTTHSENGTIGIDNRFQLTGASGRVFLMGGTGGWVLKSVMVDGRDITDEPLDLTGKASVSDVVITMTDRPAALSGQISDGRGPLARAVVVIVPADDMATAKAARLTRMLRTNPEGRYQLRGLRPERYLVAALEYLEEGRQFSPEVREQLRKLGREVTLREGEALTLDLTITSGL